MVFLVATLVALKAKKTSTIGTCLGHSCRLLKPLVNLWVTHAISLMPKTTKCVVARSKLMHFFSGITTKKYTTQADKWVLSSVSIAMCALDGAESLVWLSQHTIMMPNLAAYHVDEDTATAITAATRSVHKPFSAS